MMIIKMLIFIIIITAFLTVWTNSFTVPVNNYKINNNTTFKNCNQSGTCDNNSSSSTIDLIQVMSICNESFRIPLEYLEEFNATGAFADESDKTAMCYLRCYFEKAQILDQEKFISQKVQEVWWPATGDSVDVCNQEGAVENNVCVAVYYKAKCLMMRSIVDERNKDST